MKDLPKTYQKSCESLENDSQSASNRLAKIASSPAPLSLMPLRLMDIVLSTQSRLGELASIIQRWLWHGQRPDRDSVRSAASELLRHIAGLCNVSGLSLTDLMQELVEVEPEEATDDEEATPFDSPTVQPIVVAAPEPVIQRQPKPERKRSVPRSKDPEWLKYIAEEAAQYANCFARHPEGSKRVRIFKALANLGEDTEGLSLDQLGVQAKMTAGVSDICRDEVAYGRIRTVIASDGTRSRLFALARKGHLAVKEGTVDSDAAPEAEWPEECSHRHRNGFANVPSPGSMSPGKWDEEGEEIILSASDEEE